MKHSITAIILFCLPNILHAATTVYECDMIVAKVKNESFTDAIHIPFGAMVVDSENQFYIVRDGAVMSSPYLMKKNDKLSGVGEDNLIYIKSKQNYSVHAKNISYIFEDCREIG